MSESRHSPRSVILAGVCTAAGLLVLISLGLWQLERLAWKQDLITMAEERSVAPPEPLPPPESWPDLDPDDYAYRHVTAAGRFRHQDEFHVFTTLNQPRGAHGGQGWWVITPFELADSVGTVLVNRGFVPEARKDAATRRQGQIEGTVTIEGLMRPPESRHWFSAADSPARNMWFVRDVEAMSGARRLSEPVAPFFIDETARLLPGGLPQGGETRLRFRNDHLGYAITWFGLAAALLGVYTMWMVERRRRRSRDDDETAI